MPPTGGSNRFMPPQPVKPSKGHFDAFDYANISPQTPTYRQSDYATTKDRQPGGIGEDCLALNIWPPSVNDNVKRAVLAVFHGAFSSGSGDMLGSDGISTSASTTWW